MSWMGLDIGTSGCKAVAFDTDGRTLAAARREYRTLMPAAGCAELDSHEVLEACLAVIAEAAEQCRRGDPVRGIGVSSQGEAFTAVAADGTILTRAMVSFDTRASGLAGTWPAAFGRQRLYTITGHTAHPMFTLFKLLWLRHHQPDVWRRATQFHCFEDLLHRRLGLQPAMSYPLAGRTMLFNVREHDWDADILAAAAIRPESLARPLPAGAVVGVLASETASRLNCAPGTIVVAGGHDQPCGALGAGVTRPGKAMYGMGTVECICPAFPTAVFSEELYRANLCTYDYTAGGFYTTVAFSLTGGNLLRWYRDEWGAEERRLAGASGRDVYELILGAMPEEPTDLLVLPYFTPSGTPYFDPAAKGAVLGLHLGTTRGTFLKALLEGVSLEMRLNAEILRESGVNITDYIATGGGARSQRLVQLKADVLNRPITIVEVSEAGCLGVAMLACAAATHTAVPEIAAHWVRPLTSVEPRAHAAAAYDNHFARYRGVYPHIRAFCDQSPPCGRQAGP